MLNNYPLTEEQCLKIGGHCYIQERVVEVLDTWPPMNIYGRTCKHCGHRQKGHEQPSIKWEDSVKKEGENA